jgi:isopenicillin N synthase-like dioxygenase
MCVDRLATTMERLSSAIDQLAVMHLCIVAPIFNLWPGSRFGEVMGGSTDAFSLYLSLFKVEKPKDASKESTTLRFFDDHQEKTKKLTQHKQPASTVEEPFTSRSSAIVPPFPSDIPTASISTVDLDLLAAGDEHQRGLVYEAATGYGFFYLQNHHVDSKFMFDLASQVFSLPLDEKMKYDMGTTGYYYGYKRSGAMIVDEKGNPDRSEFYNVSKDEVLGIGDAKRTPHPDVVRQRFEELQQFMRACHRVVTLLLASLGKSLGLPDGLLEGLHRIDKPSCDQARVTHAPPIGPDTISLGEHTDFGSLTVLFNQLGGLQVLKPNTREWQYVKPRPECAVVNLGDAFVKMVD